MKAIFILLIVIFSNISFSREYCSQNMMKDAFQFCQNKGVSNCVKKESKCEEGSKEYQNYCIVCADSDSEIISENDDDPIKEENSSDDQ